MSGEQNECTVSEVTEVTWDTLQFSVNEVRAKANLVQCHMWMFEFLNPLPRTIPHAISSPVWMPPPLTAHVSVGWNPICCLTPSSNLWILPKLLLAEYPHLVHKTSKLWNTLRAILGVTVCRQKLGLTHLSTPHVPNTGVTKLCHKGQIWPPTVLWRKFY